MNCISFRGENVTRQNEITLNYSTASFHLSASMEWNFSTTVFLIVLSLAKKFEMKPGEILRFCVCPPGSVKRWHVCTLSLKHGLFFTLKLNTCTVMLAVHLIVCLTFINLLCGNLTCSIETLFAPLKLLLFDLKTTAGRKLQLGFLKIHLLQITLIIWSESCWMFWNILFEKKIVHSN